MRISDWSSDVCSSDLGRSALSPTAATSAWPWRQAWRRAFFEATRFSGDQLLFLGEGAEAEPGLQGGLQLAVAGDLEPAVVAGARHRLQTHPDLGHGPEIGRHVEVDVMAGIDRAEVDLLVRIDDEPTVAPRPGQSAVDELDGAAAARHRRGFAVAHNAPHHQGGI